MRYKGFKMASGRGGFLHVPYRGHNGGHPGKLPPRYPPIAVAWHGTASGLVADGVPGDRAGPGRSAGKD